MGKDHGRTFTDPGQHYTYFYYGWFWYSRSSTAGDTLLYNIRHDRLRDFLDWNGCVNIDDYVLKNKDWIPKRQLKKIRKYQKKLEKIITYKKDYGLV